MQASLLGILFVVPPVRDVRASVAPVPEYRLRLLHTHTGERIDLVYWRGDHYVPEALTRLDQYLRDHRTGDIRHYDPQVFDLLHDLNTKVKRPDGEIDIVCGYRSPWSNEFLRTRSRSGAAQSPYAGNGNRYPNARN